MTTILVIDDSDFSRGRVVAALAPLEHRLIEAVDGQAGLEAYDLHAPDLIVTDLLMPTLDGLGLLRGLRERGAQVPVIVVSAALQTASRQLCEDLGASAFQNKPFPEQDMVARVHRLLPTPAAVG